MKNCDVFCEIVKNCGGFGVILTNVFEVGVSCRYLYSFVVYCM